MAENAFDDLLAVHFEAPDIGQLSDTEQRAYDRCKTTHLTATFKRRFRESLAQKLRTLPRGIGAGPSGERYEHLKAVAGTDTGMTTLLSLGELMAERSWGGPMRDCRLAALWKTAAQDAIRPVTTGEALRRVVGVFWGRTW
eukprot:COSAG02_NODE_10825_length_1850_cov_1.796117_1_plen_140_part_10